VAAQRPFYEARSQGGSVLAATEKDVEKIVESKIPVGPRLGGELASKRQSAHCASRASRIGETEQVLKSKLAAMPVIVIG
jgi:hypothetical protein